MALFTGQTLYTRTRDRQDTWGSNVKSLLASRSNPPDWTVTFTSDSTITQTVLPYTNISNDSSDTRTSNGWAMNRNENADNGMGSTAERNRYIPSGDWSFEIALQYSAPALLANYNIQVEFSIYRVAAGGGARSLLFSVLSSTVNVNLQAGNSTLTTTSTQPEVTIGVGETIHFAIRLTSRATTATLGNETDTVITLGTDNGSSVSFPSPGLRSNYFEYSDGVGNTFTPVDIFIKKDIDGQGDGVGIFNRLVEFYRELNGGGEGSGERSLLTVLKTMVSSGEAQGLSLRLIEKDLFIATGEVLGLRLPNNIFKDIFVANGDTDSVFNKTVVFARLFEGNGEGSRTFNKVVIFVRTFNSEGESVIRPRICLDWDDLPQTGTVIEAEKGQLVYFDWE
jgi:hypothetical protein